MGGVLPLTFAIDLVPPADRGEQEVDLVPPTDRGEQEITVEGVVRNGSSDTIFLSLWCEIRPTLRDARGLEIRGLYPPIMPPRHPRTCTALEPGESRVVATWCYDRQDALARQGHWLWRLESYRGQLVTLELEVSSDGDCSDDPQPAGSVVFCGSLTSNMLSIQLPR